LPSSLTDQDNVVANRKSSITYKTLQHKRKNKLQTGSSRNKGWRNFKGKTENNKAWNTWRKRFFPQLDDDTDDLALKDNGGVAKQCDVATWWRCLASSRDITGSAKNL